MTTNAAGTTSGNLSFGKEDILHYDGSSWTLFFDGDAHGLSSAHDVNAIHINAADDLYMSFLNNVVNVPGVGDVKGNDILHYNGSGFTLDFDGSAVDLDGQNERIDSLHILDGAVSPIGSGCQAYLLISTVGKGKVPDVNGGQLSFEGEDILGFCATSLGSTTNGVWHMVLDGSAEGMPKNSTDSISASDDGTVIYLTTKGAFNVDDASGSHSVVYKYDFATGTFSGPYFSAPDNGLLQQVDGLHVDGDLP
jgi:hypothetical protein